MWDVIIIIVASDVFVFPSSKGGVCLSDNMFVVA